MAMLYSDLFSTAYALSPAVIDWHGDFTLQNRGFKKLGPDATQEQIFNDLKQAFSNQGMSGFYPAVFTAFARMVSPDENAGALQARFPVEYKGDSAIYNLDVIKKWEENFPMNMADAHLDALRSLTALKFDWGRNEDFPHIPFTALQLSKKLEAYGIKHYAEEYLGDHGNMIAGPHGRFNTDVLPLFNMFLQFAPEVTAPVSAATKGKKK